MGCLIDIPQIMIFEVNLIHFQLHGLLGHISLLFSLNIVTITKKGSANKLIQ